MDAIRWIFILLAIGAAAAAALWLALSGPAASSSPKPEPTPVVALPLNLPSPASAAAAARHLSAPVAAAAVAPSPAAKAPVLRVGSEGYGPHIERAFVGADAAATWEAVQWLRDCATTEQRRHSFEQMRNVGVSPEMMTQLMQEADAEGRRCQTVTAQHRALLPELALRAMRAGQPEAASVYAGATQPGTLAPALRQEVAAAMRRDALAGHPGSLLGALVTAEGWQIGETEKLGFLFAYGEMAGTHGQTVAKQLIQQGGLGLKALPTPEQFAAAKLAGQQIIDRARAKP